MWTEEKNKLVAEFTFSDFTEAFSFMTEIAFNAEQINHHPDWRNVWNKVFIELCTHDMGNIITSKDHQLAEIINKIYARYQK